MQSIKLHCHNGMFRWHPSEVTPTRIRTVRPVCDEDTIDPHLPIPAETELQIIKCYYNLYGTFIDVEYQGRLYSVKPKHVEVI